MTVKGKSLFVGIDLHMLQWHLTIRTEDVEIFCGSIPGKWEALRKLLDRYPGSLLKTVYEAGCFGFWLHDRLVEYGAECVVTPPSLVPIEYGNKVKTYRRDSRKLAHLLAKGMLKRVWVPSEEESFHRQVIRRRRQLIGDRVRIQCRIKSELCFYRIQMLNTTTKWSQAYVMNLHRLKFNNHWMQECFQRLLEEYDFLSDSVKEQMKILQEFAETSLYKERVTILRTVPGIGLIAEMELLLELQDMERFRRADQLADYVGLTPSQYSSADKIRIWRITATGKNNLRGTLIEVAWKDKWMRRRYDRIKARSGGKRAIVAIARITLLKTRRMLLDNKPYVTGRAA
jgi:transposase